MATNCVLLYSWLYVYAIFYGVMFEDLFFPWCNDRAEHIYMSIIFHDGIISALIECVCCLMVHTINSFQSHTQSIKYR